MWLQLNTVKCYSSFHCTAFFIALFGIGSYVMGNLLKASSVISSVQLGLDFLTSRIENSNFKLSQNCKILLATGTSFFGLIGSDILFVVLLSEESPISLLWSFTNAFTLYSFYLWLVVLMFITNNVYWLYLNKTQNCGKLLLYRQVVGILLLGINFLWAWPSHCVL